MSSGLRYFPLAHIARIRGEEEYAQKPMKASQAVSTKIRSDKFLLPQIWRMV